MVGVSSRFSFVTIGVKSFFSDLPEVGWYNLVCVRCLWMIKPMVLLFYSKLILF